VTEVDNRLFRCISSVFPNLMDEDVRQLDVTDLMDMDSLAAVTLVAVIDEEFGVMLDAETLAKLSSFHAIRQYLCEKTSSVCHGEQKTP
jgi:acyl carrier protein